MMTSLHKILLPLVCVAMMTSAHAQSHTAMQTTGTLVVVPGSGEVTHANDEARATFTLEEQDKDKSVAASRVNQKMKQGTEILRNSDPQARLKTHGYYTYAIYSDEPVAPRAGNAAKPRQIVAWRVGQNLEMITTNLAALPKTVAATQKILALNGLQFGLSDAATAKLDQQRIEASYKNLNERVAAIAKAMGRRAADAVVELIDFEASGAYAPQSDMARSKNVMMLAAPREVASVEEPSFEPGETTLQMRVVAKIRFK